MRLERNLTILIAVIALALILGAAYLITRPTGPILVDASFGSATITPNADLDRDATTVHYRIRREARISIYLESPSGERHYFRRDEIRSRGEYDVLFSGVVEPYLLEGETYKGKILQRLVPDGIYTWVIEAADATGQIDRATGTLEVADADTVIPDLTDFSVSPSVFTPNQDGLGDRVIINVSIPKPANLVVYLIDENGERIFIPESPGGRQEGEAGRHQFEYDGGIDNGSDPPPDGTYQMLVQAVDAEGQRVEAQSQLTIQGGGFPLAEIVAHPVGDTLRFSSETIIVGETLHFEVTIENYGNAPIRTTGPQSGHVYEQDERYNSSGFFPESGAWRVGIDCDTCLADYPWRWALGTYDELTPIEVDGQTHYYLMPGQRITVTGGIRLTQIVESRNPQEFWVGLIHEDVGIAPLNNRVDPHFILIVARDDNE